MKKYLTATLASLSIIAVIFIGSVLVSVHRTTVTAQNGIIYNVPVGMSKLNLVQDLQKRGIINGTFLYDAYIFAHRGAQVKAGEYLFPKGSTPYSIWQQVTLGRGYYYRAFMIVPGTTFTQLRQALDRTDSLRHLTKGAEPGAIMAFLGHPDMQPEGHFLPETYYYTRGDQDLVILQRAFDLMRDRLDEAWQNRSADNPFKTEEEALIAASIVEKEAYLDAERPIIAGVMINRLNTDMLLQFDPTVVYGLGARYDGKIYKKDLLEDTPYNTYVHKGLTPTPISMPGLASINAVMHPAKHNFIYFVAKGDGGHQFSATLQEHEAAVAAARVREQAQLEQAQAQSPIVPGQPIVALPLVGQTPPQAATTGGYFNSALIQKYVLRVASIAALETRYDAR